MTSVTYVPEAASIRREELTAAAACRTLRRYGTLRCLRQAFLRLRYGDGFSHARALGLQLSLAAVPLVISCVGLSGALQTKRIGDVLHQTVLALAPGTSDEMLRATLRRSLVSGSRHDQLALLLGLVFALLSLTAAMGQVERGANRIYGIVRDRPSQRKYPRALVLALGAGLPAMAGIVVLVTFASFADAVQRVYGIDDDIVTVAGVPCGLALIVGGAVVTLKHAPRRHQPQWQWFTVAAGVIVGLWLASTALLATYLRVSSSFNTIYGPLTAVIALLLWAQLTSASALYGVALAAQLEADFVGLAVTVQADAEDDKTSEAVPTTSILRPPVPQEGVATARHVRVRDAGEILRRVRRAVAAAGPRTESRAQRSSSTLRS